MVKEYSMRYHMFVCKRCGGIFLSGPPPIGAPQVMLDGFPYHFHCAQREKELRDENRKTERGHNPVLPKD